MTTQATLKEIAILGRNFSVEKYGQVSSDGKNLTQWMVCESFYKPERSAVIRYIFTLPAKSGLASAIKELQNELAKPLSRFIPRL